MGHLMERGQTYELKRTHDGCAVQLLESPTMRVVVSAYRENVRLRLRRLPHWVRSEYKLPKKGAVEVEYIPGGSTDCPRIRLASGKQPLLERFAHPGVTIELV